MKTKNGPEQLNESESGTVEKYQDAQSDFGRKLNQRKGILYGKTDPENSRALYLDRAPSGDCNHSNSGIDAAAGAAAGARERAAVELQRKSQADRDGCPDVFGRRE